MTDYKKLCAELVEKIEYTWGSGIPTNVRELLERARTALAKPEPEGPTDEELRQLRRNHEWPVVDSLLFVIARAVLARWGRPTPQPVPVSERLPGPEDCDGEGKCWWLHDEDNASCSHWLPAHALPLPTAND